MSKLKQNVKLDDKESTTDIFPKQREKQLLSLAPINSLGIKQTRLAFDQTPV